MANSPMPNAYVRSNMLPEQPAPASEVGAIGWLRANLFSGWLNTLMTVLSILFVLFLLSIVLPWAVRSSWTANSLAECRERIGAIYGEGFHGACWAVIRERFNQLIFGFYPREEQWRVILAFVFMMGAIAPVLFTSVPRKALWFSALFPAIGYWLLWGGSVWGPAMVVLGFLAGWAVFMFATHFAGAILGAILGVAALLLWWRVGIGDIGIAGEGRPANIAAYLHALLPIGLEEVKSELFGGFSLSTIIGVTGIAASFPLGILLALGRQSNLFFIKTICIGFIEFIRGVPLITLLFVASTLLNYFLPPGTSFDIILRVVIMVTLFAAAYMAEVIRGGLAALPKGQYEAADALGLDYWKAQRLIIMPQALKISIPAIVSTFIGLFKDTTLVSIIGLLDPLGLAKAIRADANWNGIFWELYAFIAVLFFIFCFSMSRYSMYLERKLKTDHR